jgi:hypothetical protein
VDAAPGLAHVGYGGNVAAQHGVAAAQRAGHDPFAVFKMSVLLPGYAGDELVHHMKIALALFARTGSFIRSVSEHTVLPRFSDRTTNGLPSLPSGPNALHSIKIKNETSGKNRNAGPNCFPSVYSPGILSESNRNEVRL